MPLIKCVECSREISDKAYTCPNCGNPIKPATIEQTRKKWKLTGLIFAILFIIGMFLFFGGLFSSESDSMKEAVGILFIFIGFFGLMYSRIGAWWSNG